MVVTPYNSSTDLWYMNFQNKTGYLIEMYGGRSIVAFIALIFNLAIVYVTLVKNFILALIGQPFIKYATCFSIQILSNITGNGAQITMVLIGIDRLFAVKLPIWYKNRSAKTFVFLVMVIEILYASYQLFLYLNAFADTDGETLVTCSVYDTGRGSWSVIMYFNSIILSGILMITYISIWFLVFLRKSTGNVSSSNRRIIKSLIIIIILNMIGVFINNALRQLYNFVTVDVVTKNFITFINSHFNIIAYSSNAPVLYFFTEKYHAAFNDCFPFLKKLNCISSTTVTSTNDVYPRLPKNVNRPLAVINS
uniref:G-protein coupled receptors family 1 profile domain-containing protein n=1 Tax=Meloidogyne floridensis TaxID=298350 RepID=A0A915NHD0_9BILA